MYQFATVYKILAIILIPYLMKNSHTHIKAWLESSIIYGFKYGNYSNGKCKLVRTVQARKRFFLSNKRNTRQS